MTRSLALSACLVSALVFAACKDVSIGGDGVNSRRDGSPDLTPADLTPDLAPKVGPNAGPDIAPELPPYMAICSGLNPAAQTCRKSVNDCIPSSCACTAGFWRCTADCPVNLPLCADGGAPDVPADLAHDPDAAPAGPEAGSDAVTCSGANPAARTCRKTANDCIPSICECAANGSWGCTADCRTSLPLCTDGGTPDLAPDLGSDAIVFPNDEQSCLKATNVPVCDVYPPITAITSATGGPLLAKVEVTNGSCTARTCASGCESINVTGLADISAGATCDLLVTATDGRSRSARISVAAFSTGPACCGYPYDGHGIWTTLNKLYFSPNPIVVDFAGDGEVVDGAAPKDTGADGAKPCAKCSATEVCVQWFDGTCHTAGVFCRAASESCRSKLSTSGVKSCQSIPECNSEFCSSPYQCRIYTPCGTEAPEAALYCYGP